MFIRPIEVADRAAWYAMWADYLTFYKTTLDESVSEATWSTLLSPEGKINGLAAVSSCGELLGFVHYLFHPVTWSVNERCYLEDLFVTHSARGRGVGRALIESVYAEADKAGADQVYWMTEQSNETAQHLYDKVGRRTAFIKYQR